ncbi:MAG TPA: hypothetical protein VKR05_04465 [Candidatus Cybelea sp.]|nr:hypothetical protein [Candidatus Cybelea sp.]
MRVSVVTIALMSVFYVIFIVLWGWWWLFRNSLWSRLILRHYAQTVDRRPRSFALTVGPEFWRLSA